MGQVRIFSFPRVLNTFQKVEQKWWKGGVFSSLIIRWTSCLKFKKSRILFFTSYKIFLINLLLVLFRKSKLWTPIIWQQWKDKSENYFESKEDSWMEGMNRPLAGIFKLSSGSCCLWAENILVKISDLFTLTIGYCP